MPIRGQGDGIAHIRIHRESLGGVSSLDQIPNVKSIYLQHDNGFYEYNIRRIEVDPVDSNAFLLAVKQEHSTVPTGSASSATIFTPYIAGRFKNSDFDSLLSNASENQSSLIFQVVDNNGSQLTPTNLSAINNRTAGFAQIQDGNYSISSYKNIRYDGVKHTAPGVNLRGDNIGYKPVENTQTYVTYFDYLRGSDPEFGTFKENATVAKLKYLMEVTGEVDTIIDDVDGINLSTIRQNYLEGANATIALGGIFESTFNNLNNSHPILKSGKRLEPIAHSQITSYDINGNITGYTTASNITFFSDDIQNSNISSDMSFSARPISNQEIRNNTVPFTVEFFDITSGADASYDTSDDYIELNPSNDPGVPFNITIKAQLYVDRNTTYRFNTTYEIQKSTDLGNTWSILSSKTVNHDDTQLYTAEVTDTITDAGNNPYYRLRVSTLDKHNLATNVEIEPGLSWIRIEQSPKSAAANTVTSNYWVVDSNDRSIISGSADLSKFYGNTQNDIADSGFDSINYPFIPQVGDELRFEATETRAFRVQEILQEQPRIILKLNKEVISGVDVNFFLLRRYVDDPAYVVLGVNKKRGTTTGGVLKPEYLPSGSEKRVEATLQELKEKNQI